jgi:hypothetical protein
MKHLNGIWYNKWGSRIDIRVLADGTIAGHYQTAVGGTQGVFRLIGLVDTLAFEGNRSFGFVVSWNNEYVNDHSMTAWSGQYQVEGGDEMLTTTWLLTRETAPEDNWMSTLVGSDVFRRTPPTQVDTSETAKSEPTPKILIPG